MIRPNKSRRKYKKTKVYPFLSQMYNLFKTKPELFVFKKMKFEGEYDPVGEIIYMDYRKEILSTLIHEVIHYLHYEWCETKVIREERKIVNSLSQRQIKNIIKRFSSVF